MKKIVAIFMVLAFVVAVAAPAFAGDRTLEGDAKAAAKYTGNVVTGSVNTVGEAAYGTGKTAISPFQAMWNWMTGKGKGSSVAADPANQAGNTIRTAADNTAQTLRGQK